MIIVFIFYFLNNGDNNSFSEILQHNLPIFLNLEEIRNFK